MFPSSLALVLSIAGHYEARFLVSGFAHQSLAFGAVLEGHGCLMSFISDHDHIRMGLFMSAFELRTDCPMSKLSAVGPAAQTIGLATLKIARI